MQLSRLVPAVFAAAVAAAPAHAQQWSGPLFSSPVDSSRFEIHTFDATGAGVGVAAAVRPFASVPNLRLRAGIMDGYGTGPFDRPTDAPLRERKTAYMAGLDYAVPLNPNGGRLRASLVSGLGVGVNASTVVSAPLGISLGYDGGRVRPYITPRLVLEHHSNAAPGLVEGIRAKAVMDLGVDIDLPVGGALRAAFTYGSYAGAGIGFSF